MKQSICPFESVNNDYLFLFKNKVKIHLSEIILLEAETNYTHLHLQSGKKITIARTLKAFQEVLENHNFFRIHRAFLINGKHLQSYNLTLGEALMTNKQTIIASRRRRIAFEGQINWTI